MCVCVCDVERLYQASQADGSLQVVWMLENGLEPVERRWNDELGLGENGVV